MRSSDYDERYQAERSYKCPCGKSYLSSPALFTHIKFKHGGVAPGQTITPDRKQRSRRRMRGHVPSTITHTPKSATASLYLSTPDTDKRIKLPINQQIVQIFENFRYAKKYPFETSEGNQTCQDMASSFLRKFSQLSYSVSVGLTYFLKEIEDAVCTKYGVQYWKEQQPDEIVDVANLIWLKHCDDSPLNREQLAKLIILFFKWMYEEKWTDHQVAKKAEYKSGGY